MTNILVIISTTVAVFLSPIVVLLAQGAPQIGGVNLVIMQPWVDVVDDLLSLEGVHEASPQRAPFGIFVTLETPEAVEQLLQKGAVFVVRGERLLELCT